MTFVYCVSFLFVDDHSRVVLSVTDESGNDYINASYIDVSVCVCVCVCVCVYVCVCVCVCVCVSVATILVIYRVSRYFYRRYGIH